MRLVITDHARFQLRRRQIEEDAVRQVALAPEQVVSSGTGREIRQSRVYDRAQARRMLLRVVVELRGSEMHVVTAYKTSKIDKYWLCEVER